MLLSIVITTCSLQLFTRQREPVALLDFPHKNGSDLLSTIFSISYCDTAIWPIVAAEQADRKIVLVFLEIPPS